MASAQERTNANRAARRKKKNNRVAYDKYATQLLTDCPEPNRAALANDLCAFVRGKLVELSASVGGGGGGNINDQTLDEMLPDIPSNFAAVTEEMLTQEFRDLSVQDAVADAAGRNRRLDETITACERHVQLARKSAEEVVLQMPHGDERHEAARLRLEQLMLVSTQEQEMEGSCWRILVVSSEAENIQSNAEETMLESLNNFDCTRCSARSLSLSNALRNQPDGFDEPSARLSFCCTPLFSLLVFQYR